MAKQRRQQVERAAQAERVAGQADQVADQVAAGQAPAEAEAQAHEAQATTGTTEANGQADTEEDTAVFATEERARAAKPEGRPSWKVWRVTGPGGRAPAFVWARNAANAVTATARADGYSAAPVDKPVNREAIASGLAALSAEEREALLAQFRTS
jgi:hypothetical protein